MALKKDIELPSGVVVRYHRILRVEYDVLGDRKSQVRLVIGSYLDKAAREAGKAPVLTEVRNVTVENGEPTRALLYTALAAPVRKKTVTGPGKRNEDGSVDTVETQIDDPDSLTGFNGATED